MPESRRESSRAFLRANSTELWLVVVIAAMVLGLSLSAERFFSIVNFTDLLNTSAVNVIFAMGLLVVLIAGSIDISFAVAASVVQYVTALALLGLGGGNWLVSFLVASGVGIVLMSLNAALIHHFRIISIVVTIATFNVFFGLLMYFTRGVSIYALPDWWTSRVILWERETASGAWAEITLPVLIMLLCVAATWLLLGRTRLGFFTYMIGSNAEATRYSGVNTRRSITWIYTLSGAMCALAGIVMLARFNSVRVGHGEAYLLITVLACFLGGVDPFGGFGRVGSVLLALVILQLFSSGLNLVGANQHLGTAVWGLILIAVMVLRFLWHRLADWRTRRRLRRERVRAAGEANPSREPESDG